MSGSPSVDYQAPCPREHVWAVAEPYLCDSKQLSEKERGGARALAVTHAEFPRHRLARVRQLQKLAATPSWECLLELAGWISRILASLARVSKTGDSGGLHEEISSLPQDEHKPLWEPLDLYGWRIHATLYLRDGTLWWLVHAGRKNEAVPRDKDVVLLDRVLDHLGAVPSLHVIIGPRSSPSGEPALPFGWWTWQNRWPLYDVQVNKSAPHDQDKIRIVPLGSRETDGYQSLFKDPKSDGEN